MIVDLSVVIPVLNEEAVVSVLWQELKTEVSKATENFEVIFVDDGSDDKTLTTILAISNEDERVKAISFTRNFGHQNALIAGIREASGNYVITMDADLQHPPSLIPHLYQEIQNGFDFVGTIRIISGAAPLKEFFSTSFYKIFNAISKIKVVPNAADYRIMSRHVVNDIRQIEPKGFFLRGFITSQGYRASYLTFSAKKREFGVSKYSFSKMYDLAVSGITSFSYIPLKLSYILFGLSYLFTAAYGIAALLSFFDICPLIHEVSLMHGIFLILFTGLFFYLSILGEYIAKIHEQLKNEKAFVVDKKIGKWE